MRVHLTSVEIFRSSKETTEMYPTQGFHPASQHIPIRTQHPPPPPPPRVGGIFQDLIANGIQQQQQQQQLNLNGEVAQLAFRVSALEQMVALQQQNNEIMLRLINALTASAPASVPAPTCNSASVPSVVPSVRTDAADDISVTVVAADVEEVVEEAIAELKELTNNGVRRAAF